MDLEADGMAELEACWMDAGMREGSTIARARSKYCCDTDKVTTPSVGFKMLCINLLP